MANFKLGLVWPRVGFARIGLAIFGSQINVIQFSEAACKISAQLHLVWLMFGLARFGLAKFGS